MPKAKEFGVMIEAQRVGDYVRYAELAETLGFGTFWVPEDLGFGGAFAIAGAIAHNDDQGRFGIGEYLRHPAVFAMEIGALDQLSNGRERSRA